VWQWHQWQKIFITLISLFVVIIYISLGYHIVSAFICQKEYISILPGVLIGSGVLVAILNFSREKQYKRDEIYLEFAKKSLDEAFSFLEEDKKNSINWDSASDLILNTLKLKDNIKTSEIKSALELYQEYIKVKLHKLLLEKNKLPLSKIFFIGTVEGSSNESKKFNAKSIMVIYNFCADIEREYGSLISIEEIDEWKKLHKDDNFSQGTAGCITAYRTQLISLEG